MMMMIDSGGLLSNARRSDGSFQSTMAPQLGPGRLCSFPEQPGVRPIDRLVHRICDSVPDSMPFKIAVFL
jgi:hypothetical protein